MEFRHAQRAAEFLGVEYKGNTKEHKGTPARAPRRKILGVNTKKYKVNSSVKMFCTTKAGDVL